MPRFSIASVGLALAVVISACQAPSHSFTPASISKTCHARHVIESDAQAWLPDPSCTPGKANPAITTAQLCPHVSSSLVRPPVAYTNQLKKQQLAVYDYEDSAGDHPQTATSTEEDHLVSRQLGGDLSSPENLWPEPHGSPNQKDAVEHAAHTAVCNGTLSLADAQQQIASNWIELGRQLNVKFSPQS